MKKIMMVLGCLFLLLSCKKETLQTYLLEKEQKPEFISYDLSPNILNLSKFLVSKEHVSALESIGKVKLLGLSVDEAKEGQYEEEKERLKAILVNSEYVELMSFKKSNNQIKIYYNGDKNAINEIIVFGYSDELGFGIARVLGNNMNPEAISKMIEEMDLDTGNFNF